MKGGRSWAEVDLDLARDTDVYGAHPYANTFRALGIGVGALPDDLRAALFGLAVFPPDTAIPVAVVARYWAHTRSGTSRRPTPTSTSWPRRTCSRRDGDTLGFHDLAHEYLLLHADGLPLLHEQLSARTAPPERARQWWQLPPDEPYVWEHLAAHLAAAGDRPALTRPSPTPPSRPAGSRVMARRPARPTSRSPPASLPDDPAVAWWQAWLARHGPRRSVGAPRNAHRITATMLAWLNADRSRPSDVRQERLVALLTGPYLTVHRGLRTAPSALVRVLAGHDEYLARR